MTRIAGRAIMAIAVIHLLFGLVVFRESLAGIAGGGFWNAVDSYPGRPLAFWFVVFAFPVFLAGLLIARMGGRDETPPAWLGWSILVFTLVLCVLMPVSGGWLMFVPAALLIRDATTKGG